MVGALDFRSNSRQCFEPWPVSLCLVCGFTFSEAVKMPGIRKLSGKSGENAAAMDWHLTLGE